MGEAIVGAVIIVAVVCFIFGDLVGEAIIHEQEEDIYESLLNSEEFKDATPEEQDMMIEELEEDLGIGRLKGKS